MIFFSRSHKLFFFSLVTLISLPLNAHDMSCSQPEKTRVTSTYLPPESSLETVLTSSELEELSLLSYNDIFYRATQAAKTQKYAKSRELFAYAIQRDPSHVEAFFNYGIMLLRSDKPNYTEALEIFDRALALVPTHAKSLYYRAKCLAQVQRKEEALVAYEKALHENTTNEQLYLDYGQLCYDTGHYVRSAELYEVASMLNPNRTQTLLSLGNTYNTINEIDKALACYRTLEERNATNPAVLYNIAYTLKKLGRLEEAFPYYKKVLQLEPEHEDAHFGLGLSYLITGSFIAGFKEYEWRFGNPDPKKQVTSKKKKRTMKTPEWDGSKSLEGKTLLLLAEQGLGDTFQFIRFGNVAREQFGATHVVAAVQKPLVQLLSLCPYLDKVVATSDPLPRHDYYAYTVSMPYLCKITRETTPTPIPYLAADETLVQEWHEKLATDKNFKVGICWQGNPNYSTQFLRAVVAAKSITLTKLLPLFTVPGVSFYNLQKMTGEEQLKLLPEGTPLISFDETFDKDHGRFMDTAAVMKNLDLMITVDTGTAHLSAGLGLPTWVFIPNPPDWRWMLDCTDTPWYPNMRLFRQPTIGDWESVIANVRYELEKLVREKQACA